MPRHPAPRSLKVVRGDRPSRMPDEPIPGELPVVMPDDLPEAAQEVWRAIVPDMVRVGTVKAWDVPAMAMLCRTYASWRQAQRLLEEAGPIVRGARSGDLVKNPALVAVGKYGEQFIQLASRFGMTPADRAKLDTTPDSAVLHAERLLS